MPQVYFLASCGKNTCHQGANEQRQKSQPVGSSVNGGDGLAQIASWINHMNNQALMFSAHF